jgi:hypothetical protein
LSTQLLVQISSCRQTKNADAKKEKADVEAREWKADIAIDIVEVRFHQKTSIISKENITSDPLQSSYPHLQNIISTLISQHFSTSPNAY